MWEVNVNVHFNLDWHLNRRWPGSLGLAALWKKRVRLLDTPMAFKFGGITTGFSSYTYEQIWKTINVKTAVWSSLCLDFQYYFCSLCKMSLLPYPRSHAPHEMMQLLSSAFSTAHPGSIGCPRHARLDLKAAVVHNQPLVAENHHYPWGCHSVPSVPMFLPVYISRNEHAQKCSNLSSQLEPLHKLQERYFIIICSSVHPNGFLNYAEYPCSEQVYPSL